MSGEQPTEEELQNMSPEEIAELQKKNCVFCKIIAGEVPSNKVYEDDKMIALLDIYPSVKGHVLVLPKEHTPIMPLIKPETFKHMFRNLKYLVRGVKEGLPSPTASVFIANGAAAGQQSPHFLFHIIPREENDGLIDVPSKEISQDKILSKLKNNLTKMMQSHLQREGKMVVKQPSKENLAEILEQNQQLMDMIIKAPEEVKKSMETNPQLKALFYGVDIDKLSEKLKGAKEAEQVEDEPSDDENKDNEEHDEHEKKEDGESKQDEAPDLDRISDLFK